MLSSLTPPHGDSQPDNADTKPSHRRTAAILYAAMARSAIPKIPLLVLFACAWAADRWPGCSWAALAGGFSVAVIHAGLLYFRVMKR
jgi:hypothetical protein